MIQQICAALLSRMSQEAPTLAAVCTQSIWKVGGSGLCRRGHDKDRQHELLPVKSLVLQHAVFSASPWRPAGTKTHVLRCGIAAD